MPSPPEPLAGPGPAARALETHSAVLLLTGTTVLKIKKPVRFAFLDFTSREQRRAACQREVDANRRLAPDVYLGVFDLVGPDGEPWDHAVVMRRLPDDRCLARLVEGDPPPIDEVVAIARRLAEFHRGARRGADVDAACTVEAVSALWVENLAEMRPLGGRAFPLEALERAGQLAQGFLAGRGALFAARLEAGTACDGHGDLQAADIFCLDDGPRILDCIEFDDHYRFGDVAADLGFLAMDLERRGAPALADKLIASYEQAADHELPRPLLHHYIAYRALVRSKVAALRAEQATDGDTKRRDRDEATMLLDLCRSHLDQARVRLVVAGGLPGTGKTTVARALADALDADLLRSDVVRKELAGLGPTESGAAALDTGLYDPATVDRVYGELLARAEVSLGFGRSVVLDASWTADRHRADARSLAATTVSELTELRCELDPATAAARIESRPTSDASDATPAVAAALAARADPWPEAIALDTSDSPDQVSARALVSVTGDATARRRPGRAPAPAASDEPDAR
jgi:aminoglycoside phosphotransferase family enzyme/predicted kinase